MAGVAPSASKVDDYLYARVVTLLRHESCNRKTRMAAYRFMWVLCQEGVQLLVSTCPGDVAGNFRDWRSYRLWLQQREVS